MEVAYTPSFVKKIKKLHKNLQNEVFEKIELFRNDPKNTQLKVHRLHGRFKDSYSFSVNYAHRIIFEYERTDSAILLDFGDHDVYN